MTTLNAIRLPGLNTDSMGNYLVAIGTLAVSARRWPSIRGCWLEREFVLLSRDFNDSAMLRQYLLNDWTPTDYERWWTASQKADTKAKASTRIREERSTRSLADVALLDAHIIGTGRNVFNPVLGTGGNVGKRDLTKAFREALKLLSKPQAESWLTATLAGTSDVPLPRLNNGGTWFVYANKTYNSGRKWFQEGLISPWSILLATEGALLLAGGVNRRLSARSRPYAVFPFVSEPTAPTTSGEVGAATAEFWAPIWRNPATIGELRAMLQRGLAQLGNRTAKAPHEFAVAAMSAGVDIGIAEFVRYELRQTTSSQVYEAIPQPPISVDTDSLKTKGTHASSLLVQLITSGWLDSLPYEPHDSKQRGKFVGLRGPVEAGIIQIAEQPREPQCWRKLLLELATVQQKVDRNQQLRKRCVPVPALSAEWLEKAWPQEPQQLPPEIEVACAMASLGSRGKDRLAFNVFGMTGRFQMNDSKLWFPDVYPAQAVWNSGNPLQTLLRVANRRLIDADEKQPAPCAGAFLCPASSLRLFLSGDLDGDLIATWIPPLTLIDWSGWDAIPRDDCPASSLDGTELVYALLKPFFHGTYADTMLLVGGVRVFETRERKPRPTFLRRLFHHVRFNEIDQAVELATARYRVLGHSIIEPDSIQADGERIAAALMIPMSRSHVASGFSRWLKPIPSTR